MNPETPLYLESAVDEVMLRGKFEFDDHNVNYLIDAWYAIRWYDVDRVLPEALGKFYGRKSIPCLVVTNGRVTAARRRWNGERWVWSRHLNVEKWRELPDV